MYLSVRQDTNCAKVPEERKGEKESQRHLQPCGRIGGSFFPVTCVGTVGSPVHARWPAIETVVKLEMATAQKPGEISLPPSCSRSESRGGKENHVWHMRYESSSRRFLSSFPSSEC